MADHYDTAYMQDRYDESAARRRVSAAGADDNHSATASLMLAAPIFLEMSRAGKTGVRYLAGAPDRRGVPGRLPRCPSVDRATCQANAQVALAATESPGICRRRRSAALYVSDMIAHNHDRERDIFQISPGNDPGRCGWRIRPTSPNEIWNESVPLLEQEEPEGEGCRGAPQPARRRRFRTAAHFPVFGSRSRPRRTPEYALQYRRPDLLRRRGPVRSVHGELRHQPHGLPRHPRHDGEHRPRLWRGGRAITIEAVARAASSKDPPR